MTGKKQGQTSSLLPPWPFLALRSLLAALGPLDLEPGAALGAGARSGRGARRAGGRRPAGAEARGRGRAEGRLLAEAVIGPEVALAERLHARRALRGPGAVVAGRAALLLGVARRTDVAAAAA